MSKTREEISFSLIYFMILNDAVAMTIIVPYQSVSCKHYNRTEWSTA